MKKRSALYLGMLAVVLAVVMIGATVFSASASSDAIPQDEIDAIVNTETNEELITSPFITVTKQVRNSVVGVNNYATVTYGGMNYFGFGYGYGYGDPQSKETLQGTGSGVVVSKWGHVLTNYHVVEGATRVTVTTGVDDEEHEATVVTYDANQDIAVLLVEGLNLPAVQLGDSDKIQVGEWAIVIGNPLGERYARTVTIGTVSGLDRKVTDRTTDKYGRLTSITNAMIQVDAAINSGNSGGGLFNTLGQLQGIPARKSSSSGIFSADVDNIGLCIPINVANPLIAEALQNYNGTAQASSATSSSEPVKGGLYGRPRLGITVSTISNAAAYGLPQGALIREVEGGSPAEEAGLKAGDIVVELDGQIIASSSALTAKVGEYKDGDVLQLKVYRDEALIEQIGQDQIDLQKVGEGEYVDVTVTIRVIDDVNS